MIVMVFGQKLTPIMTLEYLNTEGFTLGYKYVTTLWSFNIEF